MKRVVAMFLFLAAASAGAQQLSIEEFGALSEDEQSRMLGASYRTATVLLALGGVGLGKGNPEAEKMAACLQERDVDWLRGAFTEYTTTYPGIATDFGAVFAQSMAWKCGLLTIKTE